MSADDIRAAMGWRAQHPALAVRCPHCQAVEGQQCTTRSGRHPVREPHDSRIQAAAHTCP